MSDPKLGTLITADEYRDAIHIAVAPAQAGETLAPGQHVGFRPDGKLGGVDKVIGIVDPFLKQRVQEGERFWLCLYPKTVNNLRHDWSHPAFEVKAPVPPVLADPLDVSKMWIANYARLIGSDYEEVMRLAEKGGDIFMGSREGMETPPEFKEHFRRITGKESQLYFSCSC